MPTRFGDGLVRRPLQRGMMSMFNDQQRAVLATLPSSLRIAFEDQDEVAMKSALAAMLPAEKKMYWDDCVACGLWSPGKVWRRSIPTVSTIPDVQTSDVHHFVTATFDGPLGCTLAEGTKGAVIMAVYDGFAAANAGVTGPDGSAELGLRTALHEAAEAGSSTVPAATTGKETIPHLGLRFCFCEIGQSFIFQTH